MKSKIGVLGTGSFGTVITGLLLSNKNKALLYGRNQKLLDEISKTNKNSRYLPDYTLPYPPETTNSLKKICDSCDIIFSVLPTKAVRSVMRELGDYAGARHTIISCSKGLELGTLKRMTQIIKEETPVKKIGAISGPNLAKEIAAGYPSATVIASRFDEIITTAHSLLNNPLFHVHGSHDIVGAELCGALKNIYAIASGIAFGAGYGLNTRSFLLTMALREMREFSLAQGASSQTFSGLSGIGDLITTAMSNLSRNFRFGLEISKGKTVELALKAVNQTVEGYYTVKAVYEYNKKTGIKMPITGAVYRLLFKNAKLEQTIKQLLQSPESFE